ncbi:MAG: hypothetical protein Q8T08_09990 [Ignavibacteria bacterium]|nr:hypothetical protein [Ignavibacteria bacterium]
MENHKDNTKMMLNKIRVLESRILRLEEITNEVLLEVETEYRRKINELIQKKDEAQQLLIKMKEHGNNS